MPEKDGLEFEEPQTTETVKDVSAQDESAMYDRPVPKSPNSLFFRLGRFGYVSWQADNSAAVLALFMFCTLMLVLLIVSIFAIWSNGQPWALKAVEIIGQALLAIVGAVLGAGAKSSK